MEENSKDKKNASPSIPANYISILQLRERWINEKERKLKEEEDSKKSEVKGQRDGLNEGLDRNNRKNWGRNSKKEELINGGEAKFADKDESEVTTVHRDEGLPVKKRGFRKRYDSKNKKKNQDLDLDLEKDVVDCEIIVTENKTPVKEAIWVYKKKVKESVGFREKAIETQFENLSIKKGEIKIPKAQTRSSNSNHQPVRKQIGTGTMVWVKKGQNLRSDDGIGSSEFS